MCRVLLFFHDSSQLFRISSVSCDACQKNRYGLMVVPRIAMSIDRYFPSSLTDGTGVWGISTGKSRWYRITSCSVSTLCQKHDVVGEYTQKQFVTTTNGRFGAQGRAEVPLDH